MQTILEYARSEGLRRIEGQVLNENNTMLAMCRELGFAIKPDPNDAGTNLVRLDLAPTDQARTNR
jgi:acetyltransferase